MPVTVLLSRDEVRNFDVIRSGWSSSFEPQAAATTQKVLGNSPEVLRGPAGDRGPTALHTLGSPLTRQCLNFLLIQDALQ